MHIVLIVFFVSLIHHRKLLCDQLLVEDIRLRGKEKTSNRPIVSFTYYSPQRERYDPESMALSKAL